MTSALYDILSADAPLVAIIREEGSNGDREMVSAFYMAGFQCHDVTMTDLCSGDVTLDQFRGVVFVGGFSYADVFGSAKGRQPSNPVTYIQLVIIALILVNDLQPVEL